MILNWSSFGSTEETILAVLWVKCSLLWLAILSSKPILSVHHRQCFHASIAHLQLMQLSDIGFTLQLQIPHLIFMFLMLSHSLIFLPLFFLSSKLQWEKQKTNMVNNVISASSKGIIKKFSKTYKCNKLRMQIIIYCHSKLESTSWL